MDITSVELRQKFLKFFSQKGHKVLPSASLVPSESDPSVLFTTAGMQQFKPYYLDPSLAPAAEVVTCQKCIRTIDIDEVGDETHLTFFEMLGNFSFGYPEKEGSYFKEKAINLAWEFLIKELAIEPNRIHATYFCGSDEIPSDEESLAFLKNIRDLKEIKPQGKEDNFWSLGTENSPGGPTVEFYIDGVEIWNLVFNEYIYKDGKFEPSQIKGVDTGMGFERLLCKITDSENVYHTDLFSEPHQKLHALLKTEDVLSERIILDHIKAAVMIINDGVLPSNKTQGYIVRRLVRRAVIKALKIGIDQTFVSEIAAAIFPIYENTYDFSKELILDELAKEEAKFRKTLQAGLRILDQLQEVKGKVLFDLYQSYGLPMEIAVEEVKNRDIKIENQAINEFNQLLKEHQEQSRTASAGMFKGGLADTSGETTKLHTAAHLLLAALRKVLGESVTQKGSNITAERLRFDFSWDQKMTDEQIKQVENLVNENIQKDLVVEMQQMKLEDAYACGAMGVFGSKYADQVKVYSIGNSSTSSEPPFSREICGGPHVTHTGEIGHFKIQKEESSSAGVRRIKAVLE